MSTCKEVAVRLAVVGVSVVDVVIMVDVLVDTGDRVVPKDVTTGTDVGVTEGVREAVVAIVGADVVVTGTVLETSLAIMHVCRQPTAAV